MTSSPPQRRASTWLGALLGLLACATVGSRSADPSSAPDAAQAFQLFDPATVLDDGWQQVPLNGRTRYRLGIVKGALAIVATGQESASGLARRVYVDVSECPVLEWSWGVAQLQEGADIRVREREDVAASVFLMFGDPGMLFDPVPVPTLRYVWTNGRVPQDAVIANPYLPDSVRSIVVRSGPSGLGDWQTERRDVVRDFERAFGRPPDQPLQVVALFTDNDQTKEPVEAFYGPGRLICKAGGRP